MSQYSKLLDDEIFMKGETKGRLGTALTILTDMLIELNSLELYYQKPSTKSVNPAEIVALRTKIDETKKILHEALRSEQ